MAQAVAPVEPVWGTVTLSDGFVIESSTWGTGPNWFVFVHGLCSDPAITARALSFWANEHDATIFALQLPNHGGSDDVRTFEEMVRRVVEWADFQGLSKVPWVGHSLGGIISLAVAVTRPDLVSHLITVCSPTGRDYEAMTLLDVQLRLWIVAMDVLLSAYLASLQAVCSLDPYGFVGAMFGMLLKPPRIRGSAEILLGAQRMLATAVQVVDTYGIPQTRYWAVLDITVRPPRRGHNLPGSDVQLLSSHCMPFFMYPIRHISGELTRAFGTASAPLRETQMQAA
jgi:pimeloyl-ACP methyl ester carboxylesterase